MCQNCNCNNMQAHNAMRGGLVPQIPPQLTLANSLSPITRQPFLSPQLTPSHINHVQAPNINATHFNSFMGSKEMSSNCQNASITAAQAGGALVGGVSEPYYHGPAMN